MSDNTQIARSMYEAFGRGDIPAVLGILDSNVVWNEAENHVYADGNPYVGPDAVLSGVFARIGGEWDGYSATPEELIGAGDTVVSLGRYRGTCKATGTKLDAQFVHVLKFSGGKVVRFQQYADTAQFRDVVNQGRSAGA